MEALDRVGLSPEQAWLATFVAGIVTVVAAALAFTERVYHGFLWQYFWGPVRADAEGESCYVHLAEEGRTVPGEQAAGCSDAAYESTAFIAEPGYTVVSTASYIVVLVFMLAGIYLLLQRMDLRPYKQFFYALVPFMLFGGALRTVEDAFVAANRAGQTPALEFPASAIFISPFIYFTVFVIALGAFLFSKLLADRGLTEGYTRPLAAIGTLWLTGTVGYLFSLSVTTDYVAFHPGVPVAIVGLATVSAAAVYAAAREWRPAVHAGTGLVGLVVLWGHAIDGYANVLANDWTQVWNLGISYSPKHPFNELVIDVTNSLQGGDAIAGVYVGDAWPFALVKLAVPLAIVALFDREFLEESPRFAIMLLGAIVAVGLGPGTRDMLRFAFGI
jgi:uncharacterized membrane protein